MIYAVLKPHPQERWAPEIVHSTISFRSIFEALSRPQIISSKQKFKNKKTSLVRSGKSLCGRLCVLLRSVLVVRRGDGH